MTLLEALRSKDRISGTARSGKAQGRATPDNQGHQRCDSRGADPIVRLRATGDGRALARTLARVLVRRELTQEGAISVVDDCEITERGA